MNCAGLDPLDLPHFDSLHTGLSCEPFLLHSADATIKLRIGKFDHGAQFTLHMVYLLHNAGLTVPASNS